MTNQSDFNDCCIKTYIFDIVRTYSMEEEAVTTKFQHSFKSSKEYISKGYRCFTDYVGQQYTEHKKKGAGKTIKMAFAKYILVFLNIFYLVISHSNHYKLIIGCNEVRNLFLTTANFSTHDQCWYDRSNCEQSISF